MVVPELQNKKFGDGSDLRMDFSLWSFQFLHSWTDDQDFRAEAL
jgi:hypothetical protein